MSVVRKHILVVDDEANVRLMVRTALEVDGYLVSEASNGAEAMASVRHSMPDVMVLDLRMGTVDGMAVLRELSAMPPAQRPRVIVLTAHGSISLAVRATHLGAADFLEKPITPEDLRLSVACVLQQPPDAMVEPDLAYEEILRRARYDVWHGDTGRAESLLMKAGERATADPSFFNLLGVIYETTGRRLLAKRCYDLALRANPHYQPAAQNRKRLYELERCGRSVVPISLGDEAELAADLGPLAAGGPGRDRPGAV